jgi:hypothetical protein
MKQKIKLAILTLLIYGIPLFFWSIMPFSKNIWGSYSSSSIFNLLFYGKLVFVPLGIIFDILLLYSMYLLIKKDTPIAEERVYFIFSGLKKISRFVFLKKFREELIISKEEKISVLFYLVKLFFTPVMLLFLVDNISSLMRLFSTFSLATLPQLTKINILKVYFPFIFYLILIIDTLIFSFGYIIESSRLKSIVKSVEPTALGWIAALICYPPLNDLTGKILGWYSSDFSDFGNINISIIATSLSLLLFLVYLWASIALGFKASNLTNRGIVSSGPYKYVRHPAYSAKNLSWWLMGIPFIQIYGLVAILGLSAWTLIYFIRALTEERHLLQDSDYVEYSKKVKYMFIPGFF